MRLLKLLVRLTVGLAATVIGFSLASALAAAALRPRLTSTPEPADDLVELGTVFGSAVFRSEATAFRGGRVVCWYSGVDLDLRDAALDPGGADLTVWTLYGGTRIRVREGWPVDSHGFALFGGAMSSAPPPDGSGAPVLRIRHRTLFGGFGVGSGPGDSLVPV